MLFIEFNIDDQAHFEDLVGLYKTFSQANYLEKPKPMSFWHSVVPPYVKQHCNMVDYGEPGYDRGKIDFEQLIDYLQRDLEVDYEGLNQLTEQTGRLDFVARAFPYGGLDRLIYFLSYFGCAASLINAGFGPKKVTWQADGDFDCQ